MVKADTPPPGAVPVGGFLPLNHSNTEVVLCADVDKYGTRLVTGSADHRLRVFELNEKTDEWELLDTWRGHNGMILDVSFSPLPSSAVPLLASTGEDLKLKLWTHDASAPRKSGRRFYCSFSQSAAHSLVYSAVSFASVAPSDLFLAVITRDGLLSLLEPVPEQESGSLNLASDAQPSRPRGQDWRELDQFYVCDSPVGRGTETCFRLSFQQAPRPNYAALAAGLHPKALSLAVAALGEVRVYRVLPSSSSSGAAGGAGGGGGAGGASSQLFAGAYRFQAPCAVLSSPAKSLVRDVDWCAAAFRSTDLVAAACADGAVRIWELSVPRTHRGLQGTRHDLHGEKHGERHGERHADRQSDRHRNPASGIGAGLERAALASSHASAASHGGRGSALAGPAGLTGPAGPAGYMPAATNTTWGRSASPGPDPGAAAAAAAAAAASVVAAYGSGPGLADPATADAAAADNAAALEPGQVRHEARQVAELPHEGCWRVRFLNGGGAMVASSADSGRSKIWAQAVGGRWAEFSEFGPEREGVDEGEGGDGD